MKKFIKVNRIEFNQTGTRCKNPYAIVKPVSHYDTLVNAGCDLQRPVTGGFVSFGNFYQGFEKIDLKILLLNIFILQN